MSGDSDKTEEATEKKVQDAIERGETPVSRDAATAALFIVLALSLPMIAANARLLALSLAGLWEGAGSLRLNASADFFSLGTFIGGSALWVIAPAILGGALAGLSGSLVHGAPRVVLKRMKIDLSRLDPFQGAARVFGKKAWRRFFVSLIKLGVLSATAAVVLRGQYERMLSSAASNAGALAPLTLELCIELLTVLGLVASVIATLDIIFVKIDWRKNLRMTRQEVKEEYKEAQGDPLLKARRRSLALDRARRRMIADVDKATVVLVNPTHYAIAMRYVRTEGGAPLILAKGLDHLALKIRARAEEKQIPIVEDRELVRAMYDQVQIEQMIPPQFYRAIAHIINQIAHADAGARRPV
ncbi:MAG: flagellar biosynthesis protein FlhB [Hyphomicrobiales bacterium]|nr:flagellar biosynthesis protein FlhB [Hyphomicrobiales bacterium]